MPHLSAKDSSCSPIVRRLSKIGVLGSEQFLGVDLIDAASGKRDDSAESGRNVGSKYIFLSIWLIKSKSVWSQRANFRPMFGYVDLNSTGFLVWSWLDQMLKCFLNGTRFHDKTVYQKSTLIKFSPTVQWIGLFNNLLIEQKIHQSCDTKWSNSNFRVGSLR